MRHSTQEERDAYEAMLKRKSTVLAASEEFERLKIENAKLRDAAAILWECCAWETDSVGWCDGCDYHDEDNGGCKVEKVLRELGIEAS